MTSSVDPISNVLPKGWKIFIIFSLITFLFRCPSLFWPYLDIDEVMWGLLANSIVDGSSPYVTIMGEKPPLLYLVYAGVFSIFGKHQYWAVHLLGMLWFSLTGLSVTYLSRQAGASRLASLWAGVFYLIFASAPGFRILATTGELLMNLPLVLSAYYFLRSFKKQLAWSAFLSGILLLTGSLFRQQGAIQFFAYFIFLFIVPFNIEAYLTRLGGLLLGMAMAGALCVAYLVKVGSWNDFVYWVFQHNYQYILQGFSNHNVLWNFFTQTGHVLLMTAPLWVLVGYRFWKEKKPEMLLWLIFGFSLLATVPGGRFFPHYFLQAFPTLCILGALQLEKILSLKNKLERSLFKITFLYIVLLVLRLPFIGLEMKLDDTGDYSPALKVVGHYIKEKTQKQDSIFIWGWAQGIYYYSERNPATRFISSDFLTGRSPRQNENLQFDTRANINPQSWNQLFADFAKQKPTYIIDTSIGNYHDYQRYPLADFPILQHYLNDHYQLETRLENMDLYRLK